MYKLIYKLIYKSLIYKGAKILSKSVLLSKLKFESQKIPYIRLC